jgi:hypothetical protein
MRSCSLHANQIATEFFLQSLELLALLPVTRYTGNSRDLTLHPACTHKLIASNTTSWKRHDNHHDWSLEDASPQILNPAKIMMCNPDTWFTNF